MVLRERFEGSENAISQHRLEELVDDGEILQAQVIYNQQKELTKVIGRFCETNNGVRVERPFQTQVRLTPTLEQKLFSLPNVEPREVNNVVSGVIASLLPIVLIAVLIWFFFVRRIKRVARNSPTMLDLQAKASEQQERYDKILEKWEKQAERMEAVLQKMEKGS